MDTNDIDSLRREIEDLQRAVRRSNPFLRSIMRFRSYALLSLPYGIVILAYCLVLHVLALGGGSATRLPGEYETAAWIGLAAILAFGLVGKLVIVNKKVAELDENENLFTATKALYHGNWSHIMTMASVFMIVASIYATAVGHAWFVESILAIGFALICGNYGGWLERKEILIIGWYMLLAGLASLFYIESAPFVWSAVL